MWSEGDLDLETERFVLRPLARSDAGGLLAHLRDPEVTAFLPVDPLQTLGQAQELVAWMTELRAAGQAVRWGVRARDGQRLIGTCGFSNLEQQRGRRGEVGFDLAVAWWGRGVMAEVLPVVAAFGFRSLGLRRIEAMTPPENVRAAKVLERAGFLREGRLRDYAYSQGRFWDQLVYARLSDDPG